MPNKNKTKHDISEKGQLWKEEQKGKLENDESERQKNVKGESTHNGNCKTDKSENEQFGKVTSGKGQI